MATETEIELAAMVAEGRLRLAEVERERDEAIRACRAGVAYDAEIQRRAARGEPWDHGDADAIYERWITLSRAVLGLAPGARAGEGGQP